MDSQSISMLIGGFYASQVLCTSFSYVDMHGLQVFFFKEVDFLGFVFPEIFDFLDSMIFTRLSNFCQARPILTR